MPVLGAYACGMCEAFAEFINTSAVQDAAERLGHPAETSLRCYIHVPKDPPALSPTPPIHPDWAMLPSPYLGPTASHQRITYEAVLELSRATRKFPECVHLPNGTGGGGRKTWETLARNSCERAMREGHITHADIFDEEVSEVLAAETDEEIEKELIQVIAMSHKWLQDIYSRRVAAR